MERPQSVQATLVVKAQPDFVAFAQLLGEDEAAELLQETLDEEGPGDRESRGAFGRRGSRGHRFAQSLERRRTFLVLSDLRGRFGRADR